MESLKTNNQEILIELKNTSLKYGQNQVLRNIDLAIHKSEIHAVIGEHGAGKSSLAHILSGYTRADSGTILWKNNMIFFSTPQQAKMLGIEIVMQEIEQYEQLSLAQNIFGNSPDFFKRKVFARKMLNKKTDEYFKYLGFPEFRGEHSVFMLKDTEKVVVELFKHLLPQPQLLILDETFEKMTAVDINKVIPILKERKNNGLAVLFITHRIDDVYTFADKVTVIRNGQVLITESVQNIDKINLIKLAYTQIIRENSLGATTKEFYQLLKYNRAILEILPVNLIVVDEGRIMRILNNSAKSYFHIKEVSMLGNPLVELEVFSTDKELYKQICASMNKRELDSFTTRIKHSDNTETINIITISPIHDGIIYIGSMIIINDITEQEILREKLNFSERLGSIGLLASGVSHEINNPLEIIMMEVEYLRKKYRSKDSQLVFDNIEEELMSIDQIVHSLAAFSDSSSSNFEIINLTLLFKNILKLVEYNAIQRDISINFNASEEEIFLKCNKTEVKQIILNLVKNSFEAMHSGGILDVCLCRKEIDGRNWIKIVCRDTGPGICEEDKLKIFLPFFSKKTASGKNMGLGLSVSYGIINKMNGEITVKNHPEGGCVFTILLPDYFL